MTGIVFHDEMVKRMAKSTVNPDAQILETAYETGRKQGQTETIKAVLEIMETNIKFEKSFKEESHTLAANILIDVRKQIEALKGEMSQ